MNNNALKTLNLNISPPLRFSYPAQLFLPELITLKTFCNVTIINSVALGLILLILLILSQVDPPGHTV